MARPIHLYTIPPGTSFADELARGVLARHAVSDDPLGLSRVLILLPTRRAIGALGEAFARLNGGALTVLPRIRALGDWDDEPELAGSDDQGFAGEGVDLPPPISPLRRELLLMRLIHFWSQRVEASEGQRSYGTPPALALNLARDLSRLLDQAAAEGLAWDRLRDLVPAEFAAHWDVTLTFLKIVTEQWPSILASEGKTDPVIHRDAALRRAAELWDKTPPPYPVIAAGSTGSVPATAALLKTIAYMPQGAVILPGLDLATADDEWTTLAASHPQSGMRDLIAKLEATRRDVQSWTDAKGNAARAMLLREALRPTEATASWREVIAEQKTTIAAGLEGLKSLAARTPAEEAQAIALALRQAAQTPNATAALVTPDRVLARRVAAELKRWDIDIDDSAGTPLSKTVPGRFLSLVAEIAAERLAPIPLLALLKHPLTSLGFERGELRALTAAFEHDVLRGPRPSPGFDGLRRAMSRSERQRFGALVDRLERAVGDFANDERLELQTLAERHRAAAERLAADAQGRIPELWDRESGRAAGDLFAALANDGVDLGLQMTPSDYVDVIRALMDAVPVRPRYGRHPRLHIWGPLEARLQHADLMILGGLNEGGWPPLADPGPWLNRPMRTALDLSQPERRVGLSAHDFVQAASGTHTLLTRSEKDAGAPTTASRWLTRIAIVLDGAGLTKQFADDELVVLARALDRPETEKAMGSPKPCPPVSARPRKLPVTDIERWIRDPYALYAKRILKLKPLDPIDDTPAAAERGMVIHDALDIFTKQFPAQLPDDEVAYAALLKAGEEAFGEMLTRPGVAAFWWPRFERMAKWFIKFERERRVAGLNILSEHKGELKLPTGDFVLTATADRLEAWPDGTASIVDYKTGQAPNAKQVVANLAPQIPLEAAIALNGGFPGLRATSIRDLLIIQLKGDSLGGKRIAVEAKDISPDQIAHDALQGLARLVAVYDDPTMPYVPRLRVVLQRVEGDYDHLARVMEWSSGDDNVDLQ